MPLSDFKIRSIVREAARTVVRVSFYEGDITTVSENTLRGMASVTRYRRSRLVKADSWTWTKPITDAAIVSFLRQELAKDSTRTPIDQKK